ncbi:MAG: biotin/lipoyl-binding protein [Planctomycetes bacterium]|nr:biotin/lipoyl-binding protein [Planctomycetota bacterium]
MSTATSPIQNRAVVGARGETSGTNEQPASQSPIPARRRDLIESEQQYQGQTVYYVKDPMTLKYYRFAPAEFEVFQLLDGQRTLDDVRLAFAHKLMRKEIGNREILPLIQRWQKAGLLQEPGAMATARVLATQQDSTRSRWLSRISGILYMKVRAFDPDRLLNLIYPWVRWMFHPFGVALVVCSIGSAVLLVTARYEEFTSQPEMQDLRAFFNVQNIFWFWLAVGMVKVLHEFGHGLTCKHFGGECHAMGLLFMCFTPCMYCDVSDSWMLPNKWHRIAIAAAGVYVELLVASLATFVWWTTAPGVLHSLAFSAMVFGSVQTLLINANPLMRFDGYYMMSDFLEVPNLRQKSFNFTKYYLKQMFWGTREAAPGSGGPAFILYAVTASMYRVTLTAGIIWLFSRMLEPYKLQALGWVLTGMAVTSIVLVPVGTAIAAAVQNPASMRPRSWWRPLLAVVLLAGVLGTFFYVPLPRRAYAVLTLEPAESTLISAASSGRIVKPHVVSGQRVHQGDRLLEMENTELKLQVERMEQQRDMMLVQSRTASAVLDPARSQAIRVALDELQPQLASLRQRIEDLVLRAPADGLVVPEPERATLSAESATFIKPLDHWQRTVLQPENIGAILEPGTVVCRISTTEEFAAVAILSQTQVEAIQVGQQSAIKLDAFPQETFLGTVQEVSVQDVEQAAPQLLNIHGSELPAISSGPGAGQLAETHYRIRIRISGLSRGVLSDWSGRLRVGLRGRTWIRVGTQTAAQATWRWICQVMQW